VRAARLGVLASVLGFWVLASVGAARQPGYDAARDYLSALAALGASQAGWGLAMFACGALALACTAVVVRGLVPGRAAARLMLLAAAAVAVGGLARVTCLAGAAGCNAGPLVVEQTTLLSRTHSVAVATYQVLLSAALLALAWGAWQVHRRALAALSLGAATLTPLLAVTPLPWEPGTDQRVWVAVGHAVLLALAAWPVGDNPACASTVTSRSPTSAPPSP
jgi:hypothetical protein